MSLHPYSDDIWLDPKYVVALRFHDRDMDYPNKRSYSMVVEVVYRPGDCRIYTIKLCEDKITSQIYFDNRVKETLFLQSER